MIPSASSQPNAWKLRVLFILDEPVTDAKTYSHVVTELMSRSPYSDPACKDAARFFYGSPNGTALLVNESASISTHDLLEAALVKLPKKKQKTIQRHTKSQVHYSGDNNRDDLISALNAIPVDGHPYHDWISILAACKACNLEQEAIACITSTSGGNPEVITHNETGITVPYGDVKALQQAIYQLRDDEDMRYTLAKQAKKSSYQFDFNTTVEQTIKEILSAV